MNPLSLDQISAAGGQSSSAARSRNTPFRLQALGNSWYQTRSQELPEWPLRLQTQGCVPSRRTGALRSAISAALLGFVVCLRADEPDPVQLHAAVEATSEGVFLGQLFQCEAALPHLRLCDAPAFGKTLILTRAQVAELAQQAGSDLKFTNWTGTEVVRIARRSRMLVEAEALQFLTSALQEQYVKERGELELRFSRPWTAVNVPDEALTLKVLDLPTAGVTPAFITRFELQTSNGEHFGPWQAALQARIWREVWVARSPLKRAEPVREAEIARERRDVTVCREALAQFDRDDSTLELAEPVSTGLTLLARSVKARPVVHRGQTVAAVLQDGGLAITLKVEALEDGAPGQLIRIRNSLSRRDLRGKVLDGQNIAVSL
jgi:flagella basal body P-ring formation protein FlgA